MGYSMESTYSVSLTHQPRNDVLAENEVKNGSPAVAHYFECMNYGNSVKPIGMQGERGPIKGIGPGGRRLHL